MGFDISQILEMRRLAQIKSRNREENSGPSNIGGRVAEIKVPKGNVIHREIENREIRDSVDKKSNTFRPSKPRIPIRGLTVVL